MENYSFVCDSSCDLSEDQLLDRSVRSVPLSFRFGSEDKEYKCNEMECNEFYLRMRDGQVAKTSGVNVMEFISTFEPILKNGENIIYLGFSSALSMTYSAARKAAEELRRKYPKRRIATIDTLCASAGISLLLDIAIEKKNAGATFDEAVEFAERTKNQICHWFTVDDLEYLKRGGRINPSTAFFGNMLGIKPLLHVDDGGRLINVGKVRGRRATLVAMCDKYGDLHEGNHDIYISHADCIDDAKLLSDMLKSRFDANTRLITDVGPVIGSHSGPGTLALFFIGKER